MFHNDHRISPHLPVVIVSGAKDLSLDRAQILRSAHDDSNSSVRAYGVENIMQKHRSKKRKTKKPVAVSNRYTHIPWGWLVAALAVLIACLILAMNAASQGKAPTDDSTIGPPVPGTTTTLPIGGNTPDGLQTTGIFPLSTGGPIPIPANVLSPSNIARVVVADVLMSIYAGSMARAPAIGALAILREDLTTGQQSLRLYQTAQPVGRLTILAVHNDIITLSTLKAHGTFNLKTNQFRF